jgi:hypothetical protein
MQKMTVTVEFEPLDGKGEASPEDIATLQADLGKAAADTSAFLWAAVVSAQVQS